jgi:arylsulfatase
MVPTLLAAAGAPVVKEQLLKGMTVGNKTFKVHLDGYNITDAFAGKTLSPRHEFFYFDDDGSLVALRYNQYKIVFAEQRAEGADVWREPFHGAACAEAFQAAFRSFRGRGASHGFQPL